jgi:hypothetical protein
MAQYLLSESPIKLWMSGGLYDARVGGMPVWVDNKGLLATVQQIGSRTSYFGLIQLDGVFCPFQVSEHYSFMQNLGYYDEEFVCKKGRFTRDIYYDSRYCYSPSIPELPGNLTSIYQGAFIQRGDSASSILGINRDDPWFSRGSFDISEVRSQVSYDSEGQPSTTFYWHKLLDNVFTYADHPNVSAAFTVGMSYAGEGRYYLFFPDGMFALYDYSENRLVFKDRWIDDFGSDPDVYASSTVYARSLGVFLTIVVPSDPLLPCLLRVYANETAPTQLIGPTPNGIIQNLTLTEFEVHLLGEQNDSAEGFLVNWSIQSGDGELLSRQSMTDHEGRAAVTYRGPSSGGSSVTIRAEAAY